MEKVNSKNFELEYPFNHDTDLIKEKGLFDTNIKDEYFDLYNKYKCMFSNYLVEKTPLDLIEKGFQEAIYKFNPVKKENMDFYQRTDCMGFDYVYLRNNFYIENLSKEDLEYLKTCNKDDFDFIERTFRIVIDKYKKEDNVKTMVMYGPDSRQFLCNSEDIVIGLRYDEFADNGLEEDKWQENFYNQLKFTAEMAGIIELGFEDRINNPIKAIQYNEMTIMKTYDSIKTK